MKLSSKVRFTNIWNTKKALWVLIVISLEAMSSSRNNLFLFKKRKNGTYLLDVYLLQTFSTITNPDALKNMSIVTKRK